MEFGTHIHKMFELIDFKTPDFNSLDINDYEQNLIKTFLNQPLLRNVKQAKIIKEYEFYTNLDNEEKHGIIDLLLEYDDRIDLIDYKLKNITDDNYIKQLKGYQNYIETKVSKPVSIYLYSIIDGKFEQI